MTRIFRSTLVLGVVIASFWSAAARPAKAQQTEPSKSPAARADTTAAARDSLTIQEVQRAAEQLAIAVEAAVKKTTEDPALKVAALKLAKNAVTAAQVVITQQAETLQAVLDALSREIAQATAKQQAKTKAH